MTKTFVALVRDHSGSMCILATSAANDYNLTLDGIRESVSYENQKAYVSVVECGVGVRGEVRTQEVNIAIDSMRHLTSYHANGGSTPLWDSVGKAIETIQQGSWDNDSAFLVMVITDGIENSSRYWNATKIAQQIAQLQATDKWTFVFRVPVGGKSNLVRLGIPAGNIMEWEQNEASLVKSTVATTNATREYFAARSKGVTSTPSFYANIGNVAPKEVAKALVEVTDNFKHASVSTYQDGANIRDFCNNQFGGYTLGKAFYQLTKPEKVQEKKQIAILDMVSGKIYSGYSARQLLGLPTYGEIKLSPGNVGNYKIFVQSTSVNRKLVRNTEVLYQRF